MHTFEGEPKLKHSIKHLLTNLRILNKLKGEPQDEPKMNVEKYSIHPNDLNPIITESAIFSRQRGTHGRDKRMIKSAILQSSKSTYAIIRFLIVIIRTIRTLSIAPIVAIIIIKMQKKTKIIMVTPSNNYRANRENHVIIENRLNDN